MISSVSRALRIPRWSRRLHRWLAYVLGAVVAVWTVTGIFMVLPARSPIQFVAPTAIDPMAAVEAPNVAARALPAGSASLVKGVSLRLLGGRLVYHFALQNGANVFVDAATAQLVDFTDSLAVAIARGAILNAEAIQSVTRVTQHDTYFRSGALPAYRIVLRGLEAANIHVAADGAVSVTSGESRLHTFMGQLHQFQLPGGAIPSRVRKLALLGASGLTLILIVTGYVLVFPIRRLG